MAQRAYWASSPMGCKKLDMTEEALQPLICKLEEDLGGQLVPEKQ